MSILSTFYYIMLLIFLKRNALEKKRAFHEVALPTCMKGPPVM
jgi:hypothetical protein